MPWQVRRVEMVPLSVLARESDDIKQFKALCMTICSHAVGAAAIHELGEFFYRLVRAGRRCFCAMRGPAHPLNAWWRAHPGGAQASGLKGRSRIHVDRGH